MRTRRPRKSSPASPAPTSRRSCFPNAATATRCNGRCKEDWVSVIKKMAGRAAEREAPGTYAFGQKQFVDPLADYLASIRGPESSDTIPFKQRPRPTDTASSNLVVTEYALPRGGERE